MENKTGCIYVIDCFDTDDLYVGSTINFKTRISQHKYNCNTDGCEKYNLKLYQTIREYLGWENWAMFPIEEEIPIEQLKEREQFYIETLEPSLNKLNAIKNKDYEKIWRSLNRDKVSSTQKKYREIHKEKINKLRNRMRMWWKLFSKT